MYLSSRTLHLHYTKKAVSSVSGKILIFQYGSIQYVNTLCGQNAELLEVRVIIIIIIIIIVIVIINCNFVVTRWHGYFTCIQNMKSVTTKFKSEGLHEKHVVATWNLRNHLSICL